MCVCVCARACARVSACVHVCACVGPRLAPRPWPPCLPAPRPCPAAALPPPLPAQATCRKLAPARVSWPQVQSPHLHSLSSRSSPDTLPSPVARSQPAKPSSPQPAPPHPPRGGWPSWVLPSLLCRPSEHLSPGTVTFSASMPASQLDTELVKGRNLPRSSPAPGSVPLGLSTREPFFLRRHTGAASAGCTHHVGLSCLNGCMCWVQASSPT